MRESLLPWLACPSCRGALKVHGVRGAGGGHILEGVLACTGCTARYPIRGGIPRMQTAAIAEKAARTASRFAAEWKTFDHMSSYQEDWIRRWLDPVRPEEFAGKLVYEAGCGMGRHTVVVAGWGARDIVAMDLGDSVEVAFAHTRRLPNAHVIQGDILHAPLRRAFDLAFSIGVLHHLPDPRKGFESVLECVRPGGRIAVWVYGRESNEWILRYVNPLRERITARISPDWLYWLSMAPSAVLAAYTRLHRSEGLHRILPYREYMRRLADLPFREIHCIAYDQLVTPIAFYLPQDEVRRWFEHEDLIEVTVRWHNRNSWHASARVAS